MTANRTLRILIATASVAVLAACATGPSDAGGSGGDTGGGEAATGCVAFDAYPEAVPFQSDLITDAPASGATWGDGTPFEIELSEEATSAGIEPQGEFLTVVNGGLELATSQIFDGEPGQATWSNSNNVFDDALEGQPGIAQVFTISDAAFDGETYDGDKLVLGNFCVTFTN
ncbi:MAG TPA: hypothetical protein VNR36_06070 [Pseudolysinimonas sp.]|nr:hypothetical protein [Pseudolysinimonas sp.]